MINTADFTLKPSSMTSSEKSDFIKQLEKQGKKSRITDPKLLDQSKFSKNMGSASKQSQNLLVQRKVESKRKELNVRRKSMVEEDLMKQ